MSGSEIRQLVADDRIISGLRVRSELPLTALLPWAGAPDHPVDLTIELGLVPPLPNPAVEHRFLQVDGEGTCRLGVPDVAAYRVTPDGRHVTIEQHGARNPAEARIFLLGTVFAIAVMRQGLLPLHACCVRIGDRAIAFAGESGAGKSTLAAALARRGLPILADDVTVVDLTSGTAIARPAYPSVKLWQESLDHIEVANAGLERVRPALDKYHLPVAAYCATPLPLAAIINLERIGGEDSRIRPMSKMASLTLLPAVLYRPQLMARLGLQEWKLREGLKLVGAVGGLRALSRPRIPEDLDGLIAQLQALAG